MTSYFGNFSTSLCFQATVAPHFHLYLLSQMRNGNNAKNQTRANICCLSNLNWKAQVWTMFTLKIFPTRNSNQLDSIFPKRSGWLLMSLRVTWDYFVTHWFDWLWFIWARAKRSVDALNLAKVWPFHNTSHVLWKVHKNITLWVKVRNQLKCLLLFLWKQLLEWTHRNWKRKALSCQTDISELPFNQIHCTMTPSAKELYKCLL